MKSKILKAILATILLACGLTKASSAIDPSATGETPKPTEMAGAMPCVACNFIA